MPLAATQMAVEGLMICEMSQRKTNTVCYHLYVGSTEFNKPVNVTKNEQTHSSREGTTGGQCRE